MTNHPEGINTESVSLHVGFMFVYYVTHCTVCVCVCSWISQTATHRLTFQPHNMNHSSFLLDGVQGTAPIHHWGTAVNLATEEAAANRWVSGHPTQPWFLSPSEAASKMSNCPKGNIWVTAAVPEDLCWPKALYGNCEWEQQHTHGPLGVAGLWGCGVGQRGCSWVTESWLISKKGHNSRALWVSTEGTLSRPTPSRDKHAGLSWTP